jgi:hypothetical protein
VSLLTVWAEAKKALKAIYAFLISFIGSLVVVLVGDVGFSDITDGQWLSAVLLGLLAGGGVYGIKNAKP